MNEDRPCDAEDQPGADDTLPPGALAPPPKRPRRGRAILIAAGVVLLLLIATITTVLIRANRNESQQASSRNSSTPTSPPATTASQSASSATTFSSVPGSSSANSSTATQTPVAPPALLPHGREASRAAIPWSQVTDGWNLRAWTSDTDPNTVGDAVLTLYLINPIGGRYRIGNIPTRSALEFWSPDHRRAIIGYVPIAGRNYIQEWDLATGRRLTSFPQDNRSLLGYTRPLGRALLTRTYAPGNQPGRLERIGTDGSHQQYYPGSASQLGDLDGRFALYTPDGSRFVIGGQRGLAVFSNGGALLRQISNTPGTQNCTVGHWWSDREVLVACSTMSGVSTSSENVFRVPIDGGPATPLTFARPPDYGFYNAWKFSGGILAQRATSCGPGALATIAADGSARPLDFRLPTGVTGQASVVGVYQDRATLATGLCGQPGRSLISLDLRTRATSTLLGGGLNRGTVF